MSEKKILIVDDKRDFAYVLNTHLRAHGYNTITASDAVGAIPLFYWEHSKLKGSEDGEYENTGS